ncbi:MAG: hypothetical protein AAF467_22925 [Actinomycetota bacterium]
MIRYDGHIERAVDHALPVVADPSAVVGGVIAPARKPDRTQRQASGLGRRLAGILDRNGQAQEPVAAGLKHLIGTSGPDPSIGVRRFVTEMALGAIADGFGAEAVAIVRLDTDCEPAVSSRVPPSWVQSSRLTFELYGHLWRLLETRGTTLHSDGPHDRDATEAHGQIDLAGRPTWLGWQATVHGDLAAAVVRSESFSEPERVTLNRIVRSVAVALGTSGQIVPPGTGLAARVWPRGTRWRAEAAVDANGKRRKAFADAGSAPEAVAVAAAKLCRVPVEVMFAGRTELDGVAVTLVVVVDDADAPYLGLSVTDPDDAVGAMEAVFSAVAVMGGPQLRPDAPR